MNEKEDEEEKMTDRNPPAPPSKPKIKRRKRVKTPLMQKNRLPEVDRSHKILGFLLFVVCCWLCRLLVLSRRKTWRLAHRRSGRKSCVMSSVTSLTPYAASMSPTEPSSSPREAPSVKTHCFTDFKR